MGFVFTDYWSSESFESGSLEQLFLPVLFVSRCALLVFSRCRVTRGYKLVDDEDFQPEFC